jgi:hypothetical protein
VEKTYKEELYDTYSSPNIIPVITSRRMGCAGYVARMGERRNMFRVLVGNPEGKRQLGLLVTLNKIKAEGPHIHPSPCLSPLRS